MSKYNCDQCKENCGKERVHVIQRRPSCKEEIVDVLVLCLKCHGEGALDEKGLTDFLKSKSNSPAPALSSAIDKVLYENDDLMALGVLWVTIS